MALLFRTNGWSKGAYRVREFLPDSDGDCQVRELPKLSGNSSIRIRFFVSVKTL